MGSLPLRHWPSPSFALFLKVASGEEMRRPPLGSISGSSRAFPRKAGNCSLETCWASGENFAHVVVGPWRLSQMPPANLRPSSASGRKREGAEKGEPSHVRGCRSFPKRTLETLFKCKQRSGQRGPSLRSRRDKRWDVSLPEELSQPPMWGALKEGVPMEGGDSSQ